MAGPPGAGGGGRPPPGGAPGGIGSMQAAGTTRWSSRLVHGGLRYLEHAELGLVYESLHERETLLKIAPHLVQPLRLLIPIYSGAQRGEFMIAAGMWLDDFLSIGKSVPRHEMCDARAALDDVPALKRDGLFGAAVY